LPASFRFGQAPSPFQTLSWAAALPNVDKRCGRVTPAGVTRSTQVLRRIAPTAFHLCRDITALATAGGGVDTMQRWYGGSLTKRIVAQSWDSS
jgi:hypothetical protein